MTTAKKIPQAAVSVSPEAAAYWKIPTGTGDIHNRNEWNLSSTSLGCGMRILQGWSTGIGIYAQTDKYSFRQNLKSLINWSAAFRKNASAVKALLEGRPEKFWQTKNLEGGLEAPIAVGRYRCQFLDPTYGHAMAGKKDWLEDFQQFIKENNLGEVSITHGYKNAHHTGDDIRVAMFTWNGNRVPDEVMPEVKTP